MKIGGVGPPLKKKKKLCFFILLVCRLLSIFSFIIYYIEYIIYNSVIKSVLRCKITLLFFSWPTQNIFGE